MNDKTSNASQPTITTRTRFYRWLFSWRTIRRTLVAVACFATLTALFYTEENWRGKRAWENCKRELEARGMVLDWNAYIPPPVPDDENFFKAPKMQEWFVGRGANDLSKRLEPFNGFYQRQAPVAELSIVPADTLAASKGTDLVLTYKNSVLALANDPKVGDPLIPSDTRVLSQINRLIRNASVQSTNNLLGPNTKDSRNSIVFFAKPLNPIKPARIELRTDLLPTAPEIQKLLHLSAEPAGTNSFRLFSLSPGACAAADYLAWSDPFESDFDLIREALKRPYARMEGDYQLPAQQPIPNFVCVRIVAQTLADRVKCHLLLHQPEQALRDVLLMHDMCRLLDGHPAGKVLTLVAAMINVAVTGLYTTSVEEGLRSQAWGEPELAALEKQLAEINLLPLVYSAFEQEPAAVCRTFELAPAPKLASMIFFIHPNPTLWEKLKNPTYLPIISMPRGWVYQNMANIAVGRDYVLGSFARSNHFVLPHKVEAVNREAEQFQLRRGPYNFLAAIAAPNFAKAVQRLAQNQTHADQALLACALERYRLANGQYPETLDALAPQFLEKIPHDIIGGQPLHYRRTEAGKFLLYSIGWNEKDDGGVVALNKDGKEDQENGDWVWPMPAK